jgi:hypothetical protein
VSEAKTMATIDCSTKISDIKASEIFSWKAQAAPF